MPSKAELYDDLTRHIHETRLWVQGRISGLQMAQSILEDVIEGEKDSETAPEPEASSEPAKGLPEQSQCRSLYFSYTDKEYYIALSPSIQNIGKVCVVGRKLGGVLREYEISPRCLTAILFPVLNDSTSECVSAVEQKVQRLQCTLEHKENSLQDILGEKQKLLTEVEELKSQVSHLKTRLEQVQQVNMLRNTP